MILSLSQAIQSRVQQGSFWNQIRNNLSVKDAFIWENYERIGQISDLTNTINYFNTNTYNAYKNIIGGNDYAMQ